MIAWVYGFNPRAPRGARRAQAVMDCVSHNVSIHAPRAGRDRNTLALHVSICSFNPRAPRGARHQSQSVAPQQDTFQSTRPARGATGSAAKSISRIMFQSTRPARGATMDAVRGAVSHNVSIHAPRAGRDPPYGIPEAAWRSFNPRAPRGARLCPVSNFQTCALFQSTRPARGATQPQTQAFPPIQVSIHAPRAGRDQGAQGYCAAGACFNPRAPRGARQNRHGIRPGVAKFQSTRPARGATVGIDFPHASQRFQSTRPARGATPGKVGLTREELVSIHAPRAGRDQGAQAYCAAGAVSIHAPRAGRDGTAAHKVFRMSSFNPRAPRGARPSFRRAATFRIRFQSTRPARGATPETFGHEIPRRVSIHAPRAGRDRGAVHGNCVVWMFQSTRPARGATIFL